MTNQDQNTKRSYGLLALVGFLVLIIVVAWLSVQIVRLLPGAFASLAQLAEGLNTSYAERTLEVASSDTTVASDKTLDIMWSNLEVPGTYTFRYECTPGVALEVRDTDGDITQILCDTPFVLPRDVFTMNVRFTSDVERFVDLRYEITFTPENDKYDSKETSKVVTIVNPRVPLAGETSIDVRPVDTGLRAPETHSQVQYRYVEETVYETPVSDPNGYTELAVSLIDTGVLESGNTYVSQPTIEIGERGAFRFEVKNTGTKTSTSWSFEATLPSGEKYTSKTQEALKPQERTVLTVAFDNVGEEGTQRFSAKIIGGGDTNSSNNAFTSKVIVID